MPFNAVDYFRRKQIFDQPDDRPQNVSQLGLKVPKSDLMSRITRGNSEGTPYPTSGGVNLPASDVSLEVPSGLPEMSGRGDETAALANRAPFKFGVPETGALGNVEARQQADALGLPSSGVRNGAILPPKMHHGFWDRLKQVGEGAVIGMGRQAEQNARSGREQSLESLLGAGAAGGVVGGASPLTIDAWKNAEQAQRDRAELGQQQGLEGQRVGIDAARVRPLLEAERLRLEAERQKQQDERAERGLAETERYHRATENRPRASQRITLQDKDGNKYYADPGTGKPLTDEQGNVLYAERAGAKPDLVGERQGEERQRKFDAANRELGSLVEAEKNAATLKDTAYQEYGNLQAQYSRQTDADARAALKPQLDAAKQRAEEAQKFYASFGQKKTDAQKAIDENAGAQMGATEKKIYDAAKAKGLDPDEAVRRYKTGKY